MAMVMNKMQTIRKQTVHFTHTDHAVLCRSFVQLQIIFWMRQFLWDGSLSFELKWYFDFLWTRFPAELTRCHIHKWNFFGVFACNRIAISNKRKRSGFPINMVMEKVFVCLLDGVAIQRAHHSLWFKVKISFEFCVQCIMTTFDDF